MAMRALSSSELLNFIIYDTITATPQSCCNDSSESSFLLKNDLKFQEFDGGFECCSSVMQRYRSAGVGVPELAAGRRQNLAVQAKKKRRRRPKLCKNKEDAEAQRMTHIAVERNRRKQMNEHLAVLRSLMPESYVQRGDQASIVGGTVQFIKELEHMVQFLESQKLQTLQGGKENEETTITTTAATTTNFLPLPIANFSAQQQSSCSHLSNKYTSKNQAAVADIEVTLIETHANIKIMSKKRVRQLSKMVACFQTLYLYILHLNVTTLDPLVLYSISAKVEEGCLLNSADEISSAIHHMLRMIEEEATLC
uniref:Transcription factor bHLH26 n=1 Tax=Nothapodytes nimmoniana TaxID=159386 RepID=A0A9E9C3Z5_NOTNI|nr:transcription factor bHLH26 [Nothapodytes nimmoniana]